MMLGKRCGFVSSTHKGLEEEGKEKGDIFGRSFKASSLLYMHCQKRLCPARLGELPRSGGGGGGGEEQETHHFI